MMAKRGRKHKYEVDVKPRFNEIKTWCELGATEKEIAENLGIAQSTWYEYKKRHKELMESVKKWRKRPVQAIKAALYRRAVGFSYSEIKETENSNGFSQTERYTKTALPDPTAAMMLLKHWDAETEWTTDPATLKLKKKELELKEKESEADW